MKLQNQKKIASNAEKRAQKQAKKDMNEMEWHKMDHLIFSAMHMRKPASILHQWSPQRTVWKTTRAQQGV